MAVASTTVWEVRPATGSDTNGGGFVPGSSGTDWSQQAAAQYAVTDGVTAGTTTITSATAAFGTDVVGNLIFVSGGTGSVTAAWYQIISRTNATTIVVDRSTGLTAGTGVTLNIGGALASLAQIKTNFASGQTAYATGTFTLTTTITWSGDYQAAGNGCIQLIGYSATRGDGGKCTVTSSTNSCNLFTMQGKEMKFFNISFTHTAGTRGSIIIDQAVANSYNITFENCTMDGGQYGVNADYIQALLLHNCEIKNSIVNGYENQGSLIIDCFIHDNGQHGVSIIADGSSNAPGPTVVLRTTFYNNTSNGINNNAQLGTQGQLMIVLSHCNFVSNGIDGLFIRATSGYSVHLDNNIFYGNASWGVLYNGSSGTMGPVSGSNNAFGSNTAGARSNFPTLPGDISLTADPFTSKSTGDFSLNSTAGGGAACKAAGFPGTLNAGGSGSANIGVLDPAASSSTTISVECNTALIVNRGGVAGY